jgi:IS5 family transposase
VTAPAANVHDFTEADNLPHDEKERVCDAASYRGVEKREEHQTGKIDKRIPMRSAATTACERQCGGTF